MSSVVFRLPNRGPQRTEATVLTAKKVERAKPGRYHDDHGLYLQVRNSDNKSWLLRYERDGKERWYGLGPAHTFSLKEARERARAARQLLHDGTDPIEDRKAKKAARALAAAKLMTFRECAETYIADNERAWKSAKHAGQWTATLEAYVHPHIGNLPVASVDIGLVLKCIEPIWRDKTETASRVRGRIESILDWATVRKYRHGDNPARWSGYLEHVLPAKGKLAKVNHHAALAYAELPTFMATLRTRTGVAARALEFTILTAARTGETIGARWPEIDLAAATWTVPPARMKSGQAHKVPLSERAVELLKALYREGDEDGFLFIGSRPGSGLSNMSMTAVLRRMGRGNVTTHGFRSSFRDWAAEQTNYPNHVVEMALAHAVGGQVEAAYRRGDLLKKRRQLAEAWTRYCTSQPAVQAAGDNVVPMSRGRA
jgi:integrase